MNPIDWMMSYESGGKSDGAPHTDPNDPGGATQWGISSKYYPKLAPLIREGKLKKHVARAIYEKLYNQFSKYGAIDPRLHFYLFDRAVHGHLRELTRLVQALANGYEGIRLKIDGLYGRNTAKALRTLSKFDRDAIVQSISMIYPSWLAQWGDDTGHSAGFLHRAQKVVAIANAGGGDYYA